MPGVAAVPVQQELAAHCEFLEHPHGMDPPARIVGYLSKGSGGLLGLRWDLPGTVQMKELPEVQHLVVGEGQFSPDWSCVQGQTCRHKALMMMPAAYSGGSPVKPGWSH